MIIAAKGAAAASGAFPYRWVAAGSSGALATSDSTDLTSWTARTSSFGTTAINGVASNGADLYVAVGDSGKLATSTDGITWTQRTSGFGTDPIYGIAYGGGYWVAVGLNSGGAGSGTRVCTSTDGITWTSRTISGTPPNMTNAAAVTYGAGKWFAMGGINGTASGLQATDPTGTWTEVTTASLTLGSTMSNLSVLYASDQSIWVAGADTGTTGALASTTTASLGTWTARTSAFSITSGILTYGAFVSNASAIAMIALKTSGPTVMDIQSSTNGTTWTDRTPAWTDQSVAGATDHDLIAFISLSTNKIQTSADGATWTNRVTSGLSGTWLCLCHSRGLRNISS